RPAFAVVIDPGIAVAVRLMEPAAVVVNRREDGADLVELAVELDLLVEDLETVPLLQVLGEVEVPLEDGGQPVGEGGRSARYANGLLQRTWQSALDGAHRDAALEGLPVALPAVADADHLHAAAAGQGHRERGQGRIGIEEGGI